MGKKLKFCIKGRNGSAKVLRKVVNFCIEDKCRSAKDVKVWYQGGRNVKFLYCGQEWIC